MSAGAADPTPFPPPSYRRKPELTQPSVEQTLTDVGSLADHRRICVPQIGQETLAKSFLQDSDTSGDIQAGFSRHAARWFVVQQDQICFQTLRQGDRAGLPEAEVRVQPTAFHLRFGSLDQDPFFVEHLMRPGPPPACNGDLGVHFYRDLYGAEKGR